MKYVLDVHTHTIASGHAYHTIKEMAQSASEKGLELLGITEHAMTMPGTCSSFYFSNLKMLERKMFGVEMLFGVELNIQNLKGEIDMEMDLLRKMDIVIASMHVPCMKSGTREEDTKAYRKVMENPYVNIIGHPDDGRYPVDFEELVLGAKEQHVLLEVNNNSLDPRCTREKGEENVRTMLAFCEKYQVPVVVNSDAHTDALVGCHCYAEKIIEDMRFPEELIVNRSTDALKKFLKKIQ